MNQPSQIELCIYNLLGTLGVSRCYRGAAYTAYAVTLIIQDPLRLQLVTKDLYPSVARYFGTQPSNVERNIRTVISYIWDYSLDDYGCLGFRTRKKPSVSSFLCQLTDYVVADIRPHASTALQNIAVSM